MGVLMSLAPLFQVRRVLEREQAYQRRSASATP
jgi:hypothetical protein